MDIATTQARKATTARRDMMKTSEQSYGSAISGLDRGGFLRAKSKSRQPPGVFAPDFRQDPQHCAHCRAHKQIDVAV